MDRIGARVGIVGGSGMLGRTIAKALLDSGVLGSENLWISNRSGRTGDLPDGVTLVTDNQSLAKACDIIVLSVPPASFTDINIHAPDRLVISVLAGISLGQIMQATGSHRAVRAMSSPAAEIGAAFSPWIASRDVTDADRKRISILFGACGSTVEVEKEDQIECFTAITGPVPGFVAFFAECMVKYAEDRGISSEVADLAIRQLFLGAGRMIADGAPTPAEHVQEMIDYAGTTAAGLISMRESPLEQLIANGLDSAVEMTRRMG